MSQRDDDIIDFDFFDEEPATEQATARTALRRASIRPGAPSARRPPGGAPQQFTPPEADPRGRARAIFFVVVLVFWIQGCRSDSRRDAYANYMESMATLANSSEAISSDLQKQLTTPGIKQADLIERSRASPTARAGGPERREHRPARRCARRTAARSSAQFRVSASTAWSAFRQDNDRDATRAGTLLAEQASGSSRAT